MGIPALILACESELQNQNSTYSWNLLIDNYMENVCMEILKYPSKCALSHINPNGCTALIWACCHKKEKVCMEILRYPNNCAMSAVGRCYGRGKCNSPTVFKKDTCVERMYSSKKYTALMYACEMEMTKVCMKMLETPDLCNLSYKEQYRSNVLELAESHGLKTVYNKIFESLPLDEKAKVLKSLKEKYFDKMSLQLLINEKVHQDFSKETSLLKAHNDEKIRNKKNDTCTICYGDDSCEYYSFNCSHAMSMCEQCCEKTKHGKCPMCREQLTSCTKLYVVEY